MFCVQPDIVLNFGQLFIVRFLNAGDVVTSVAGSQNEFVEFETPSKSYDRRAGIDHERRVSLY